MLMRVTLESTSKVVYIDGVAARVWEGTTEGGVPCFAFITRIAPSMPDPPRHVCVEFERDLRECKPLSPDIDGAIPARLLL
jgi:hypothetical protein